jgi:hypothetical protein
MHATRTKAQEKCQDQVTFQNLSVVAQIRDPMQFPTYHKNKASELTFIQNHQGNIFFTPALGCKGICAKIYEFQSKRCIIAAFTLCEIANLNK